METQIEALTNFLNENDFKATAWQDRRIYINSYCGQPYGKDMKVYIDIDEPLQDAPNGELQDTDQFHPLFAGCALKVFSNATQSKSWLINRAKQVKHAVAEQLHYCGIFREAPGKSWEKIIL